MNQLAFVDWAVVAAYFCAVYVVVFWHSRTNRANATEFFLAGRNAGWFVVGASIFASNIGSEHLVGLAGSGAAGAFPAAQFELLAAFALLLLGWLFVPFYIRSGVFTMPEFLERRYSAGARYYLAAVSILAYVLTKISVTIAAGGIVFEALMGIDFWTGAVLIVIATGIYTVIGGMRAVLYSDMMQAVVMIGGGIAVTVIGLSRVGGWDSLMQTTEPAFLNLWRASSDPDFPWTGILFGAPILAVWYWCTDQFIVQRTLSAQSISAARRATIFAALLKQLPLFIFVLPGVIAYALAEQGVLELADPDQALPALIGALLPVGVKGLVVAGLLAALMSSLSSVFNSCATLITMDVYQKLAPHHSERRLVVVGTDRHGRHGAVRACLDSIHGHHFQSAIRLSAERAVVYLAADCGRLFGRRDLASRQCQRRNRSARHRSGYRHRAARRGDEPVCSHGRPRGFRDHQFFALRHHSLRRLDCDPGLGQPLDRCSRRATHA